MALCIIYLCSDFALWLHFVLPFRRFIVKRALKICLTRFGPQVSRYALNELNATLQTAMTWSFSRALALKAGHVDLSWVYIGSFCTYVLISRCNYSSIVQQHLVKMYFKMFSFMTFCISSNRMRTQKDYH